MTMAMPFLDLPFSPWYKNGWQGLGRTRGVSTTYAKEHHLGFGVAGRPPACQAMYCKRQLNSIKERDHPAFALHALLLWFSFVFTQSSSIYFVHKKVSLDFDAVKHFLAP
jgi:hypothetical protein